MKQYIGCSGYYYKEWKGAFYPADLPASKWLSYYCQHFNTIEINASFYRFPELKNLKKWYDATPDDFVFSIKVPQTITHHKKFRDVQQTINDFYAVASQGLQEKLRCILFQLPPSMAYSPQLLETIVNGLDAAFINVIEFRHVSWWRPDVYEVLKQKNAVFCAVSFPNLPEDLVRTSDTSYVRFHGIPELYKSAYSPQEIRAWAEAIQSQPYDETYIYFNNTWYMAAIENAKELERVLDEKQASQYRVRE